MEKFKENVYKAIDSVRPYLTADGGDVEVVDISSDYSVKIKLLGACDGCPFSFHTVKAGIESAIKRNAPELKEVVAI